MARSRKSPPRRPKPLAHSKETRASPARMDWLSRALARAGVMTLAEAEHAIQAGRVEVSGRVVKQPLAPLKPTDVVRVDGQRVALSAQTRVIVFHKPMDVVTAPGEGGVFEVLSSVLPDELRTFQWHAVGRLDRNTTGLLLFTNDEQFVAHATSPETHLTKRYVAQVQGQLDDARLEPLRRGMELDDGPTRPAKARIRGPHEVEILLTEGRNHQVKRMLGEVGLPVRALHREAVGGLELDVELGGWRLLEPEEIREKLHYEPRG